MAESHFPVVPAMERLKAWGEKELKFLRGHLETLRKVLKALWKSAEEKQYLAALVRDTYSNQTPEPSTMCPFCGLLLDAWNNYLFRVHLSQCHMEELQEAKLRFSKAVELGLTQDFAPHLHPLFKRLGIGMELLPSTGSKDLSVLLAKVKSLDLLRYFTRLQLQYTVCELYCTLFYVRVVELSFPAKELAELKQELDPLDPFFAAVRPDDRFPAALIEFVDRHHLSSPHLSLPSVSLTSRQQGEPAGEKSFQSNRTQG